MTVSRARSSGKEITSPSNPLVKAFRAALAEGTTREGWVAVEGPRLVSEALDAGEPGRGPVARSAVQTVLLSQGAQSRFGALLERLPSEAELAVVPDRVFGGVAQTETPQGIAALVEIRTPDLGEVLAEPSALLVVACGLQDPGNLGAILRSAHALGASAVITLPATVSPFNPKAVRSSGGAIFKLPVFRDLEPERLVGRLHGCRVQLVATDRHSAMTLAEADLRGPVAFLIGKEAAGLDESILRQADLRLGIPIRAGVDSMNAAVAAGIFLYEAARQRGFR